MKLLLVALALIVAVYAKNEEYVGWKSYTVGPPTQDQLKLLGQIVHDSDVDVLSHPIVARAGVVLVKPRTHDQFLRRLEEAGIPYVVHSADVFAALEKEEVLFEQRRQASRARNGGRSIPHENYYDYNVIDQYIQDIAAAYPDTVTLVTPANSYEGRPIRYLKISTTNFEDTSKPVIFIDGGIHSREWISPPSVTYIIKKLVEDVTEPDLLDNFDWIILPVVNPDGYQYTFTHSRFWRKTRSTNTHVLSFICPGVDGNRNYDFFWDTTGTSPGNPCTDVYAGSRAFSEIETQVVQNIIQENLRRMALYITMHSYGSMILYPWGHDGSLPGNAFALHTVGVSMAQAMDAASLNHFPNYVVGNSVLVVGYPAAGASEDYAHLVGVPLSYTFELPGLAGGFNGFHLDPIHIEQVVDETWKGVVVGARRAGELW